MFTSQRDPVLGSASAMAPKARDDERSEEDAPDELLHRERHHLGPVVVGVVSPTEAQNAVAQVDEAIVGDRDPVGVAGEVGEDLL